MNSDDTVGDILLVLILSAILLGLAFMVGWQCGKDVNTVDYCCEDGLSCQEASDE